MKNPYQLVSLIFSVVASFLIIGVSQSSAQDFNRDIRPILSDRCFKCHGPDEAANDSGLRLDIESEAHDAEAFVPGDIESSTAIERMTTDDADLKMPPADSHLTVSPEEIELVKKWVQQGAKYDQHWSFKPLPKTVIVPHYSMVRDWIQNDIDVFVLRSLDARKLQPSPESEKWRWLRRVTFDLSGLPPTAQELAEFENDDSPNAYEKVVDRLLDSDRFGEHMAVSWLDAARYGDSYGYQSDQLSPTWPYRDWVVRAINKNLPYNDFLTWQIAGDQLPDATHEQILATAFNRLHRQTNEGGSVELEWRTEYVADRVNTFGTAILGMTLECARCHDHKFDPITHRDYYNLSAFFNNIDEWGMYHDSSRVPTPSLLLPTPEQEAIMAQLEEDRQTELAEENRIAHAASKLFDDWLIDNPEIKIELEPAAHWTLDELGKKNQLANEVDNGKPATTSPANKLVNGFQGKALKMTGDDPAEFPVDGNWLEPWQPFTVSFWIKIPDGVKDAIILHRQGGTDVGNFGTKVSLENRKVRIAMVRFWPGNAVAVESKFQLRPNTWHHVVVTNDGRNRADGMHVYIDGEDDSNILRDRLTKDPQHRPKNNPGFVMGEQFRRVGLKAGLIDEVMVFNYDLSAVETKALHKGVRTIAVSNFDREELKAHHVVSTELMANNAVAKMSFRNRGSPRFPVRDILQVRVGVAETMVMKEMDSIRPAHVLHRGEYDAPRTKDNQATRATPGSLPAMPESAGRDRLGLAQWLTSDDHPLTARVAVNRFWQGFFGNGLADTPNDFGYQSSLPVYPQLLDWLSRDFVDNGWDVKRLCKTIVLSSTYRQSSRCDEALRKRDPENRWLGRGPSQRLSAEMIRDMALFTSGLMDQKVGGPPVSPYQPENIWRENNTMSPGYRQSVGKGLYRRSLYTVWKRTTPMPNMMTFDATSREVCMVQRSPTNTPQQAMVLLNDVQFVEAARATAERALKASAGVDKKLDENDLVQWLFVRLTGRQADEKETIILVGILSDQRKLFSEDKEAAQKLIAVGESKPAEDVDTSELAAVTVLTQAILNSDAAIWKR